MTELDSMSSTVYIKDIQKSPSRRVFQKLKKEEILFLKSHKDYVAIVGNDFIYKVHSPLYKLIEKLNYKSLLQTHKSYAVNINKIDYISNNIITINDFEVLIGNTHKKSLLDRLLIL
jgi:DNA-binding LytR/AlgR family response regulator